MGTVAPFRIKGGLDLDGKVQFQVFSSAPSGFLADSLSVGSLAIAQDSGKWYRKTTIGAGPDKWAALTTSMDLIGIAPNWLSPVDAAITGELTLAQARTAALALPNLPLRVLCARLSDTQGSIFEVGFYPAARVAMDPTSANPAGSFVYELRSTLPGTSDTSAGNALTFVATTDNPLDATETTCTITGNAIAVNLKNSAGLSTATILGVIRAIEAVDTANLVRMHCPDLTAEQIAAGADPTTPMPTPIPLTAFSGGSATRTGFEPVAPRTIKGVTLQNHVGDTVYVQEGAEKGSVYSFNSDHLWVKQGQSNTTESGFIQTFIGKSGDGAELPTYSSTDVVTQGANLEAAIGQLDASMGDLLSFMGTTRGEEVPIYASSVVVEQNATLNEAISQLDREVGYLLSFIGKEVGNEAPFYLSTKVIGQGSSLEEAISALDDRIGAARVETHPPVVTGQTTVDSIVLEQELAAEWLIHAREVAHPNKVYVTRVIAAHNASIGVPATEAIFNESGIIELSTPIPGLEITMDLETSGPLNARTMRLRMASAVPVDVTMTRSVLRRAA
ncbi:MAG: hypothetical protein HQM03_14980 [Magnetococcales bacterium]|nr:hypothetical protein [Magnetococcales bacterium]